MTDWMWGWQRVLFVIATCSLSSAAEFKSFTSPDGEYSVKYPSTWVHYPAIPHGSMANPVEKTECAFVRGPRRLQRNDQSR